VEGKQLMGGGDSMAGGVSTTAESAEEVYRMRFLSGPVAFVLALTGGPDMELDGVVDKPTTLEGSVLLRLLRMSAIGLKSAESSVPFAPMLGLPLRACSTARSSPPSLSELAEQKPASRSLELGESKNNNQIKELVVFYL